MKCAFLALASTTAVAVVIKQKHDDTTDELLQSRPECVGTVSGFKS